MATYEYTDILIDNRLVCEKMAVFPYARYTIEFCVKFPFLWYSQVQDRSRIEEKFMCKNVSKQTQHAHCDNDAMRGGHVLAST